MFLSSQYPEELSLLFIFQQTFKTPCDPMGCSTAGFPVLHHLPEFAQTHVRRAGDAKYLIYLTISYKHVTKI